jgi:hypothetical protein
MKSFIDEIGEETANRLMADAVKKASEELPLLTKLIYALESGKTVCRRLEGGHLQGMRLENIDGKNYVKLLGWMSAILDPVPSFTQMVSDPTEWEVCENLTHSEAAPKGAIDDHADHTTITLTNENSKEVAEP